MVIMRGGAREPLPTRPVSFQARPAKPSILWIGLVLVAVLLFVLFTHFSVFIKGLMVRVWLFLFAS
jgi:hypothetical protein